MSIARYETPPLLVRAPRVRPILPKVCWSRHHGGQAERPPVTHIVVDPHGGERSYCEPCAGLVLATWQRMVRDHIASGDWTLSADPATRERQP